MLHEGHSPSRASPRRLVLFGVGRGFLSLLGVHLGTNAQIPTVAVLCVVFRLVGSEPAFRDFWPEERGWSQPYLCRHFGGRFCSCRVRAAP
ncbi:hypothetical protein SBV1_230018 [Verrucomicrobia bacterium]|nr:hypothetical protein SBV1_230018 [Verrucomicrobiota bacterium]